MIFTVAKNALRISTSKTSFALKKIRPKFTDNLQIYLKKFCESIPRFRFIGSHNTWAPS